MAGGKGDAVDVARLVGEAGSVEVGITAASVGTDGREARGMDCAPV